MKRIFGKIRDQRYVGKQFLEDEEYERVRKINLCETKKIPLRSEIINFLLSKKENTKTTYLEIGVRFPEDNFQKVISNIKYGVDPGIENKDNPVDFKMTSDDFFYAIKTNKILDKSIKFDVIFIDGLHEATQVEKDIMNSLEFIKEDGFIVLHDCNPPTEYHTREDYNFHKTPSGVYWNGTTWKAFYKSRLNDNISCACIDSDWGVGIISKKNLFGHLYKDINPFFEYSIFDKNRKESLNLLSFEEFKIIIEENI